MKTTYTSIPDSKYYIQSSPEIHELIRCFAKEHNIPASPGIDKRYEPNASLLTIFVNKICRVSKEFPGIVNCREVSLSDWIAMFRTPQESFEDKHNRLTKELLNLVGISNTPHSISFKEIVDKARELDFHLKGKSL